MDFFEHRYYRVVKILNRLIGRWHYQSCIEQNIVTSLVVLLCSIQFIPEVLAVIAYSDDEEVILESITPFMIDIMSGAKYLNSICNKKMIRTLFERIKEDWKMISNSEEKKILEDYANIGRFLSIGYIGVICLTTIVFVAEPLSPKLIQYILKTNETISSRYPVPIYWIVPDMEKNYSLILPISCFCIVVIVTTMIACDVMFIVLLQHACGLFAVVGHKLKNLPSERNLQKQVPWNKSSGSSEDIHFKNYVLCIKNHKRAIEFAELLESTYVWCFGVVTFVNMLLMSMTAIQIVIQGTTVQKTVKYTIFACAQMIHLFFDCFLSQQLMNHSLRIEKCILHGKWYESSLKSQKLLRLMILRSQVPCRLTAGKLIVLSMENFAMIVKTAGSYFTVFLSRR